ncbi:MAG: Na+/H+ antiporter subunit E [Deltaproteobacteria bacterium]|nr:Na+/H+ antiporter subunit E [Deltaproteobacteria bacterium]
MTLFLWNILLMLVYVAVSQNYSAASFGVGFLLGYLVLWASQRGRRAKYFSGLHRAVAFVFTFIWELLLSNFKIAVDVLRPKPRMRPGIFAYPLEAQTDGEITLLANIITLTPGTLSLDVSTDRKTLYIHGMYLEDPEGARRSIKEGFERRVLELLR